MSGSKPAAVIRISAEGADQACAKFEAVGTAGTKAFADIQRASIGTCQQPPGEAAC